MLGLLGKSSNTGVQRIINLNRKLALGQLEMELIWEEDSKFVQGRAGSPGRWQERAEQRLVLLGGAGPLSSQLCGFQGPCRLFRSRCLPFSGASRRQKRNVKITALSPGSLNVKKLQVLSGADFSTLLFSTLLFSCPGLCSDDLTLKSLP